MKSIKHKYLILFSFIFLALTSCRTILPVDQVKVNNQEPNNLEIYLLIGQSNMAGRAAIELVDQDTLENVFLFSGIPNNEWEKAAHPLNKYSTIRKKLEMQQLGPGYTFGREMSKAGKGKQIGLVVNAKGGTGISAWLPETDYFNEAVSQIKAAMKYGRLKGIVWQQGESDASKYESYTAKIIMMINAFRTKFNNPNLPVVVGQLSEDKDTRIDFNKMIIELPSKINHVSVVKTENTTTLDSTHFDSQSQRLLGERYATAMLKILKN